MSKLPFVCLNVEPESDVEDAVDNTAEIQLEEALKLYQTALKLHSQGPAYYEEARNGYDELFKSEVFSYPDATAVKPRDDAREVDDDSDSDSSASDRGAASDEDLGIAHPASDSVSSTLSQVLYLSYKNYAQFQLDILCHELAERGLADVCIDDFEPDVRADTQQQIAKCLDTLCNAVAKDDSDPSVWRQISRLAALLGSPRLNRYCLEAVLQTANSDGLGSGSNIESALASEDLQQLRERLQDKFDLSTRPSNSSRIPKRIRKALDPCPGLPEPSKLEKDVNIQARTCIMMDVQDLTWKGLGRAVLSQLQAASKALPGWGQMGTGYRIEHELSEPVKTEPRGGRKRKDSDTIVLLRPSFSEPPAPDHNETQAVEDSTSPPRLQDPEQPCSPTDEHRLPVRTFSIESNKTESAAPLLKSEIDQRNDRSGSLKRSPDAAGIQHDPPEARGRSKRLRARETGAEEENLSRDLKQQIEKQMKPLNDADRHLFHVNNTLLNRMGIDTFGSIERLKETAANETSAASEIGALGHAIADFNKGLKVWNANRSNLLNHGSGAGATATLISKGNEAGLANFMEHAKTGQRKVQETLPVLGKEGVSDFVKFVNRSWLNVNDLAFAWIAAVVSPTVDSTRHKTKSRYLDCRWGKDVQDLFHEILADQDAHIIRNLTDTLLSWNSNETNPDESAAEASIISLVELIQTLFEIQLDVFNDMIKPTSKVDQPTRTLQKARLQRWSMLASQAVTRLDSDANESLLEPVCVRHLFSMILYMSLDEANVREQIISGLHDAKEMLKKTQMPTLLLPNVDILPEISVDAVDQEISRLTTTDFFMSVFNPSDDDPVIIIESLEPILMPSGDQQPVADLDDQPNALVQDDELVDSGELSQKDQLQDFLEKSTASLRLSLWSRLSAAYTAIDYPPMIFICTIRSIGIVLSEIENSSYSSQPEETRQANLLVWMRNLIDLIDKCLSLTANELTALDGMDDTNLKLGLSVISQCTKLFHIFTLWDDGIRTGQAHHPTQQSGAANSYKQAMTLLRDMQVKTWRLLYILLRDAAKQNPSEFPDADDDFLALLAAIHSAVGLREYCKLGKKSFLKFLKPEILALEPSDLNEWRYQMAQVTYDLYDLRVLADSNTWMTLQEHNCPADQLDKTTAREILPMVMAQISAMKLKELTKPDRREFKLAIDEIQELVGVPKANYASLFNRRQLNAFQKSPLRTEDLERCLKGAGGLTNMPVRNEFTVIAKTGWFFVVGYLRLASFRSVRRQGPDSTKELDEAAAYLRIDIDYNCSKWETWYRLAQVYDSMLDEEVAWSADRINNKMDDLIGLQRQAIHCYQMALALSVSQADNLTWPHESDSNELREALSELYSDFGMRLYAASRPPFNMQAFSVKDHGRWYYTPLGHKFKAQPFTPTRDAQVWLVASVLFRQALVDRSSDWLNWYMLGKCLWKLLHHPDAGGVSEENVLDAFAKACEIAPVKDPRRDGSPTLEPHQKLVSVVHKLVHSRGLKNHLNPNEEPRFMDRQKGYEYLLRTPHSKKVDFAEPHGPREWLAFVRGIIKSLRVADKTNWHHRIITRAADLAYKDPQEDSPAQAALTQLDIIITKTMALNVWRPGFERVGRHFVYTTRYVRQIIDLLKESGERGKLELLGKRVRKKQAEFIDHQHIWAKFCKTYIDILRSQAEIPDQHEERVLSVLPFEKFVYNAALLHAWAQPAERDPPDHPLLPVLRELFDLKKLNLNLIANQGIDDLIGDTYAKLYEERVPDLVKTATTEKNREAMRVDRILMADPDLEEKAEGSGTEAVALTNPSGRAKIVGRMEVRRRAEALVQRLSSAYTSQISQTAARNEDRTAGAADDGEAGGGEDADMQNDADDESELSELDEDDEDDELVARLNVGEEDEGGDEQEDTADAGDGEQEDHNGQEEGQHLQQAEVEAKEADADEYALQGQQAGEVVAHTGSGKTKGSQNQDGSNPHRAAESSKDTANDQQHESYREDDAEEDEAMHTAEEDAAVTADES